MTTDIHDLTGVYAGGSLPASEVPGMEEHLRSCTRCAQETRELLETTALLGVAAAAPPPAHLRALVLAAAVTTPQLPPLLRAQRGGSATVRRGRSSARRWPLAAAACLAALGLGVSASQGLPGFDRHGGDDVQAQQAAPVARTLTVTTAATSATVTLNPDATRMTFAARGLRELQPGRTYQLWLLKAGRPRPAGTFALAPSGEATAVINGPGEASTLLVTDEPAGGSPQPTTQPVLTLDLQQA